jgi:hypothetical protein
MDLLQLNKFGDLHDGKHIIFCKSDYLKNEFKKIKKLKNEVILISGNGDHTIDDWFVSEMPDNILKWYCQNNSVYHDKLIPIPIGLENTLHNKRKGHGVAWPHARQKIIKLNNQFNSVNHQLPAKLLYANFNEQTNLSHRQPIKELCLKNSFITWHEPLLEYNEFINAVLDHEAVVCPAGNGIDTHRLYEILYCNRIPVVVKMGNYPLYTELYEKLPIVILDTIELIIAVKQKNTQQSLLDFQYWKQLINTETGHIIKKDRGLFYRFLKHT